VGTARRSVYGGEHCCSPPPPFNPPERNIDIQIKRIRVSNAANDAGTFGARINREPIYLPKQISGF